jgi:hypothetical protein
MNNLTILTAPCIEKNSLEFLTLSIVFAVLCFAIGFIIATSIGARHGR